MSEKIYIVTLYKREDLEGFYSEMKENGFRVNLKRPLSRATHYWMTSEQAEELKQDPRVWDVELNPDDAYAYATRGGAYNQLMQYGRAVDDLDKSLKLGLKDEDNNIQVNIGKTILFHHLFNLWMTTGDYTITVVCMVLDFLLEIRIILVVV